MQNCAFSQGLNRYGLEREEQEMLANSIDGKVRKQTEDLNGDGEDDIIFFYAAGETHNICIYLQYKGRYYRKIDTTCGAYSLYRVEHTGKSKIQLHDWQCCGDSPFFWTFAYGFDGLSVSIVENFITVNNEYVEDKKTCPVSLLDTPYHVKTLNSNYNIRFSPDTDSFFNKSDVWFTCTQNTNIIATLKAGANLKVLSEQSDGERIWLYVEVRENSIMDKCETKDFFNIASRPSPSLRGWISRQYTERIM
ncbi:MAG: hypothetical protein LBE91_10160 [Tannerella sp.]|jgi:hypothetical protein|nr:hypothetical protein [Tannerella sp.]